jgi:hypothetical protein
MKLSFEPVQHEKSFEPVPKHEKSFDKFIIHHFIHLFNKKIEKTPCAVSEKCGMVFFETFGGLYVNRQDERSGQGGGDDCGSPGILAAI